MTSLFQLPYTIFTLHLVCFSALLHYKKKKPVTHFPLYVWSVDPYTPTNTQSVQVQNCTQQHHKLPCLPLGKQTDFGFNTENED